MRTGTTLPWAGRRNGDRLEGLRRSVQYDRGAQAPPWSRDARDRRWRVDVTELVRQVERKYGRPTEGTAANGSWCVGRCGFDLTMEPHPRITVRSDAWRFKILGSRGRNARLGDEAAITAAAAREAPAAKRGAF